MIQQKPYRQGPGKLFGDGLGRLAQLAERLVGLQDTSTKKRPRVNQSNVRVQQVADMSSIGWPVEAD